MSDITERLRAAIGEPQRAVLRNADLAEAAAEIERLRQETGTLTAWALEERGKVERLTAALRNMLEASGYAAQEEAEHIARAALEGDEALFPTKKICPECGQRMREGGYCDHIPF